MEHQPERYPEIREAVRDLCRTFPDEYHRKVDAERSSYSAN